MPAYKTVAVAGATGNLGPTLVRALVDAGFEVTTLSRSGKADGLPSSVKVVTVDYDSQDSLVNAVKGHDAVVSNLPNHEAQRPLIDAAIKAGIKRFIPSEFGSDIAGNKPTAELPVFKGGKLVIQQYLKDRADQISYTFIVNGFFLDWGIGKGLQANFKGPTTLYNSGDSKKSMTLLDDIGKATSGVLKHPEETKNRAVYIQSAVVSQNELLDIGKKLKPDWTPEIVHKDTADLLKESYAQLAKGGDSIGPAMLGFVLTSIFDDAYGSNWADKNDNELLGVKELSKEELEKLVARNI